MIVFVPSSGKKFEILGSWPMDYRGALVSGEEHPKYFEAKMGATPKIKGERSCKYMYWFEGGTQKLLKGKIGGSCNISRRLFENQAKTNKAPPPPYPSRNEGSL